MRKGSKMRGDIYRKLNKRELRRYTTVRLEKMNQMIVNEQRKNEKIMFGIVLALVTITIIFFLKLWLWTKTGILCIIWYIGVILVIPMPFLTTRLYDSSKKIIKELKRRE